MRHGVNSWKSEANLYFRNSPRPKAIFVNLGIDITNEQRPASCFLASGLVLKRFRTVSGAAGHHGPIGVHGPARKKWGDSACGCNESRVFLSLKAKAVGATLPQSKEQKRRPAWECRQAFEKGRPGTIPLPSRIVTSRLAAWEGYLSTTPDGQNTSISAVFSAPSPKCRRGSLEDM